MAAKVRFDFKFCRREDGRWMRHESEGGEDLGRPGQEAGQLAEQDGTERRNRTNQRVSDGQ